MAVIVTTLGILKDFLDILRGAKDWNKEKVQANRDTIVALGNASSRTAAALKKLRAGDKRVIQDLEIEIANLWNQAAALLHNQDKEMALMLFGKAKAWRDAESWSEEDFETANENLVQIDEYVTQLIKK